MKLIYIMDPLCGWCYGIRTIYWNCLKSIKNEIKFEILPGGMWVGENVRRQSPQMVSFFLVTIQQLEEHTGIEFGNAYRELLKQEIVLDKRNPFKSYCNHTEYSS